MKLKIVQIPKKQAKKEKFQAGQIFDTLLKKPFLRVGLGWWADFWADSASHLSVLYIAICFYSG